MATARSSPINVPKKPEIIKGPWDSGRLGRMSGQFQPMRSSPPHNASSKAENRQQ